MKTIPLSRGLFTKVDDDDYEKYASLRWYASKYSTKNDKKFLAMRAGDSGIVYLHRIIVSCPEGLQVDHINNDSLDNRKINLRICTNRENNLNRPPRSTKKLKMKGVYFHGKTYSVRIKIAGKDALFGRFKDIKTAGLFYDKLAIQQFGKYAYLNFPDFTGEYPTHEREYWLLDLGLPK